MSDRRRWLGRVPRRRRRTESADASDPVEKPETPPAFAEWHQHPDGRLLAVVPYVPVRCRQCGARHARTTGRHGARRYHLCRECGAQFLSVELDSSTLEPVDDGST